LIALGGFDQVVIARGSVPVVRLVRVEPLGRRKFGTLKGKMAMDARFDESLPEDELGWTSRRGRRGVRGWKGGGR
jgi:antitoxin (DNA-binding transcriptional repressor) of toxin-antitoxin stability system